MKTLLIISVLFFGFENRLQGQPEIQTEQILSELQELENAIEIGEIICEKMVFVSASGDIIASVSKDDYANRKVKKEIIVLAQKSSFMFESLGNIYYLVDQPKTSAPAKISL